MIDIAYFYLGVAILTEIVATSALKASDGFTRLLPAAIAVAGYVASFYCLSLALRTLPLGIAYALWSGRASCCCRSSAGSGIASGWTARPYWASA